ncbi:ethanolamine utilization protein EutH [Entomomonas sp. E2T0]|uniref:ethanolamine utilization protein EutH n=1 Tax=Entomomonas sp. E2T0 TaxID=2930213 RepID=UPI00222819B3|nr:ethanolamine utilization protein EutH [Entomomonas sp. E2T0]UYZ83669.1 ethanolamine utilization protein EutH [Entomomonas sp. E2T0]
MGINEIIVYIMMAFMIIAAFDRILNQFGGSESILSKIGLGKVGKGIDGSGSQFEEGFMAMGALGLAMVGITALAPVIATYLGPLVKPLYEAVGADPSMFAGTILACDMGGFFLAKQLATSDAAALYSGIILAAMMGPTIVFTIPVALGIIDKSDRRYLALGVLAGIVTIPVGCIAAGLIAMFSGVELDGRPATFTFVFILVNMIPVIIIAALIVLGLKLFPEKMISGFQVFAKILVGIITVGLVAAVLKFTTDWTFIPGMDPIFSTQSPAADDMRAMEVIGSIACILLGAYPMVFLITRWFGKPLMKVGGLLKMNDIAAAGMIATLANNIPMFSMMSRMDERGKIINCAFAVSAAFTLGDHLGFVAGIGVSTMIFPMIVGKLVGGITAVGVAMMIAPKTSAPMKVEEVDIVVEETSFEAEAK